MDKDLACVALISIIGLAISLSFGIAEELEQSQLTLIAVEQAARPGR